MTPVNYDQCFECRNSTSQEHKEQLYRFMYSLVHIQQQFLNHLNLAYEVQGRYYCPKLPPSIIAIGLN